MKLIFSEYLSNYKSYSYAYGVYAMLENKGDVPQIYDSGFLPYTGSPEIKKYFYLCRSLRVNLHGWKLNSENKRILKKVETSLTKQTFESIKDLNKKDHDELFDFYLNYFKKMHGENIMPPERLKFILEQQYLNRIVVFRDAEENLVGSILMVEGEGYLHFWYSAYSDEMKNTGFGLWLMLNEIEESKERSLKYFYLGTCYGEKAKYKLNFENLEFFDGEKWNGDMGELKERIKGDLEKEKEFDLLKKDKKLF